MNTCSALTVQEPLLVSICGGLVGGLMHFNSDTCKCISVASSPGLPMFSHVTSKNMGRPGDEAILVFVVTYNSA